MVVEYDTVGSHIRTVQICIAVAVGFRVKEFVEFYATSAKNVCKLHGYFVGFHEDTMDSTDFMVSS